ncbi:MAG TPA: hypothetical protein VGM63_04710 [Mucilaginibacter sp.]
MKKKLSFISLFIFASISQLCAADTILIKAKVLKIDTVGYYFVIHAEQNKHTNVTIFSSLDEKNKLIDKYSDSTSIQLNDTYTFLLVGLSQIKIDSGAYMFNNLRGFLYNNKRLLEADEMPYLALNMYKFKIYFIKKSKFRRR